MLPTSVKVDSLSIVNSFEYECPNALITVSSVTLVQLSFVQCLDFNPSSVHVAFLSTVNSFEYECLCVAAVTLVSVYPHPEHTCFSNPSLNGPAAVTVIHSPYVQSLVSL